MNASAIVSFPFLPAIWSYGLAGLVFVAFAGLIIFSWRGGIKATALLCAIAFSALWAGTTWSVLVFRHDELWRVAAIFDAARLGCWLIFLTLLLETEHSQAKWGTISHIRRMLRYFGFPIGLLLISGFVGPPLPWVNASPDMVTIGTFYGLLASSVFGLVLCEQLYKRTPKHRRWAIKPLLIGLAGMFGFDLLIQSGAILFHQIEPAMWAARGLVNATVIALVGIATARNTSWTVDVYVSRDVVYQSTALLLIGIYLLIVASAAYWVVYFGGDWGETFKIAFVFAALLGLAALLLSGSLRARLRVMISKNLFAYRYEYRQEWLRFTRALGTTEPGVSLYQRVIQAMADLAESVGGAIWLERGGVYSEIDSHNLPRIQQVEKASGSLVAFLARTDWVIRMDEVFNEPDKYENLIVPEWLMNLKEAWLVIPLPNGADLIGFVVLGRPRTHIDVNWEVRDLLKTASRQAASYIAQIRAKEALVETEQFDAFNRMSAFVVHDLKNLVAQLALVLKNAERHRDNPDFQRDVLETVENAVGRMNQLMLQLRTGTTPMEKPRPVDLGPLMTRILNTKGTRQAIIDLDAEPNIRVLAHEDRIERVIGHLVQNAIEATEANDGHVRVRMFSKSAFGVIAISDDGIGMSEQFVREQLFHPFQTTKPQGMGIGMYESIQYVNSIGGRITVESAEGAGTRFDVYLPLAIKTMHVEEGIQNAE